MKKLKQIRFENVGRLEASLGWCQKKFTVAMLSSALSGSSLFLHQELFLNVVQKNGRVLPQQVRITKENSKRSCHFQQEILIYERNDRQCTFFKQHVLQRRQTMRLVSHLLNGRCCRPSLLLSVVWACNQTVSARNWKSFVTLEAIDVAACN